MSGTSQKYIFNILEEMVNQGNYWITLEYRYALLNKKLQNVVKIFCWHKGIKYQPIRSASIQIIGKKKLLSCLHGYYFYFTVRVRYNLIKIRSPHMLPFFIVTVGSMCRNLILIKLGQMVLLLENLFWPGDCVFVLLCEWIFTLLIIF
jgi:hypothetical protein